MTNLATLPHYPTVAAKKADFVVHIVGLVLAVLGGAVLLSFTLKGEASKIAAVSVYAGGLVLMLSFSLAYNFAGERRRPFLRRLDHAGIFLMIAGSYTPFTTHVLTGVWAWGMTIAVWTIAGFGIVGKILLPHLREGIWIAFYLMMGWIVVIALRPISAALAAPALVLLVVGGLLYTLGIVFHVKEHLTFSRSIWHGHVLAGACVHWVAILIGTVLPVS